MTTVKIRQGDQAGAAGAGRTARARDVLHLEWTKLISVRSTYWALLVAAVLSLAGSALFALFALSTRHGAHLPDPVALSFVGWVEYPVLAVGILGVLTFTSECTTGQIRTTFTAVPRRPAVLAAKAALLGSLILVFGELLAVASFALTQAILSRQGQGISLSHPGVVFAAGFVLGVVALIGVTLGAAIRHTAGAIAALPAVFYLPLVLLSLPSPWNHWIGRFTLPVAAYQVVALHPATNLLAPALSMLVLIAWPAIALAAAAALITRRAA